MNVRWSDDDIARRGWGVTSGLCVVELGRPRDGAVADLQGLVGGRSERADNGEIAPGGFVPGSVLDKAVPAEASQDLRDLSLGRSVGLNARDAVFCLGEGGGCPVDFLGDVFAS